MISSKPKIENINVSILITISIVLVVAVIFVHPTVFDKIFASTESSSKTIHVIDAGDSSNTPKFKEPFNVLKTRSN